MNSSNSTNLPQRASTPARKNSSFLSESIGNTRVLIERSRVLVVMPNAEPLDSRPSTPSVLETPPRRKSKPRINAQVVASSINNNTSSRSTPRRRRRVTTLPALQDRPSLPKESKMSVHEKLHEASIKTQINRKSKGNKSPSRSFDARDIKSSFSKYVVQTPEQKQQQQKHKARLHTKRQLEATSRFNKQSEDKRDALEKLRKAKDARQLHVAKKKQEASVAKKWITNTFLLHATSAFIKSYVSSTLRRQYTSYQNQCASIIQRFVRSVQGRVYGVARIRLGIALRPILFALKLRRSARKRREYGDMVRQFITEYATSYQKLRVVTITFRQRIITVQRYVRGWLLIQAHRKDLLSSVWDTIELSRRNQIKKAARDAWLATREKKKARNASIVPLSVQHQMLMSCSIMNEPDSLSKRKRALSYGNYAQKSNQMDIEINSLVRNVVWKLRRAVHASSCILYLHDLETNELRFRITERATNFIVPDSCGIAGLVSRTGTTVNCTDAYDNVNFDSRVDRLFGIATSSLIAIPVLAHDKKHTDKVIAVLQMANKTTGHKFSIEDTRLLQVGASYVGASLTSITHNAHRDRGAVRHPSVSVEEHQLHQRRIEKESKFLASRVSSAQEEFNAKLEEYMTATRTVSSSTNAAARSTSVSTWNKTSSTLQKLGSSTKLLSSMDEVAKQEKINELLANARKAWISEATSEFGAAGSAVIEPHTVNIADVSRMLSYNNSSSSTTSAFSKRIVTWPPFLLLRQDIVTKIYNLLYQHELEDVRKRNRHSEALNKK